MTDIKRLSMTKTVQVRMMNSFGASPFEPVEMRFTAWARGTRGGFEIYDTDNSERYYAEGGLWFSDSLASDITRHDLVLTDYDGIYALPIEIQVWLDSIGLISKSPNDYHRKDVDAHYARMKKAERHDMGDDE